MLSILLISCFEQESPISPVDRGDLQITEIEMTEDYVNQLYFDLSTNSVVRQNRYDIWHLAFECYEDRHYIRINDGKVMRGIDLGKIDFLDVPRVRTTDLYYDKGDGTPDSTIISKWWTEENGKIVSKEHIYYLDLGFDADASRDGNAVLKINGYENDTYSISWYLTNEDIVYTAEIKKDPEVNHIMFSLENGGEVLHLEPPSTDWDLIFTKYTDLATLQGTTIPYSLTGALINEARIGVAKFNTEVDSIDFNKITFRDALQFEYSNKRTAIGYDWKLYDFDLGYSVQPNIFFVIREDETLYYRFRFLDFLNDEGLKGYPEIAYLPL